ncbi:MAG: tetratricopeptide repeat protein [Candidatus Rifleibacteriota bacterium]
MKNLIILCCLIMVAGNLYAQPYDLLLPGKESPDNLSKELRSLQAIQRDLAIEKLTREPSKLEAYLELAELRSTQGKLQEAQRFYEMALKIDPENREAKVGLAMVHYHKGEFNYSKELFNQLHSESTIADDMQHGLAAYRRLLKNEAQLGLTIREDDRGLSEVISSIEGRFPSTTYQKLTGIYRYENWMYEDNGQETNTQILSSFFDYKSDENTSFSIGIAPEIFSGKDSLTGYSGQFITGSENLHIALSTSKQTFKENLQTVRAKLSETNHQITLYGDLNPRTRVIQTITATDLSDGNLRRRYDSELLHYIYREGAPFLSMTLKLIQMGYEQQFDNSNKVLPYWAPSDFRGGELTLSWERSIGSRWWWGIDTNFISNNYKFETDERISDNGAGALIHLSYKFDSGRVYASIGDRIHNYFRERKLEIYGSFDF